MTNISNTVLSSMSVKSIDNYGSCGAKSARGPDATIVRNSAIPNQTNSKSISFT